MGRKRTSNKKNYIVSVDKDLMEKLMELEVNRSLLFTDAAKEFLDKEYGLKEPYFVEQKEENEEKE